jgi:hypothetical protein
MRLFNYDERGPGLPGAKTLQICPTRPAITTKAESTPSGVGRTQRPHLLCFTRRFAPCRSERSFDAIVTCIKNFALEFKDTFLLPTLSVERPFQAAGRLESLPHRGEGFKSPSLDGRGHGEGGFGAKFNAFHHRSSFGAFRQAYLALRLWQFLGPILRTASGSRESARTSSLSPGG